MDPQACWKTYDFLRGNYDENMFHNDPSLTPEDVVGYIQEAMSHQNESEEWREKAQQFLESGACFPYLSLILQTIRDQMVASQQFLLQSNDAETDDEKLNFLVQALQTYASNKTASKELGQLLTNILEDDVNPEILQTVFQVQHLLLPSDFASLINVMAFQLHQWDVVNQLMDVTRWKDNLFIRTLIVTNRAILLGNRYLANNYEKIRNSPDGDLYTEGTIFEDKEQYRWSNKALQSNTFVHWLTDRKIAALYRDWFRVVGAYVNQHPSVLKPTPDMIRQAAMIEYEWYVENSDEYPLGAQDNSSLMYNDNDISMSSEDEQPRKRSLGDGIPQSKRPKNYSYTNGRG